MVSRLYMKDQSSEIKPSFKIRYSRMDSLRTALAVRRNKTAMAPPTASNPAWGDHLRLMIWPPRIQP
jgi:hypothetical protein